VITRISISLFCMVITAATNSAAERSTSRVSIHPKVDQLDSTPPSINMVSPDLSRSHIITTKGSNILVAGITRDDKGVSMVTVNDITAKLNEKGEFSAEILLKLGDNLVTVASLDTSGNKAIEQFKLIRQGDSVQMPGNFIDVDNGKKYALVIGINQYQKMTQLNTAVNDAQEISKVLKEYYNFVPTLLINSDATRSAILKELISLKKKMSANDSLLIYFAGHGWKNKITETSYWMPVDADHDSIDWIDTKTVIDELRQSQARQILVVADSCFSGTITRDFNQKFMSEDGNRENFLYKLRLKPTRILISSGGDEPVNDSGGSGHSVFTDVLLRALKKPFDDHFTAEELMTRHIKESVAGSSKQTPEYKIIQNSGHEGGDFVFTKIK